MSNQAKVILLAFACFSVSISEFVIVGIIDVVASSVGVSVAAAGQLLTAFALSGGIGVPILVVALSKLDRRYAMAIALALVVVGCVLMAMSTDYVAMMASRVFMAIGSGVFSVTAFATAPGLAAKGKEISTVATITLGYNAALVLGLPIGRFLVEAMPWTAVFWIVGAISVIMIPVVLRIVPSTKGEAVTPLVEQLKLLKRPRVLFTLGISLFWVGGYAILYSYITPYLQETTGLEAVALSAVLLVFGIATLVGNKLGGFLGDKLGVRLSVVSSLVIQIVMLGLLFFLNGPLWLVLAAIIIWGVVAWIPSPVSQVAIIQAAPEATDTMLSLNNSMVQLAYALGAGLGGVVVAAGSTHLLCVAGIVLLALAIGSTMLATRGVSEAHE